MFRNRKLVVATMHGKEKVIAPLLFKEFGIDCLLPANFDTDRFGTFTGEIQRKPDPLAVAREKCRRAMDLTGCDLGIASEGSFGAHPSIHFLPADEEIIILIDLKNDLEIVSRVISTATNLNGRMISTYDELLSFAKKIQFPSHGLILSKSEKSTSDIYKGITDLDELERTYRLLSSGDVPIYATSDMRAMNNPSRMLVIEEATQKLVQKMNHSCPICSCPGFDISGATRGLPCGGCGRPTDAIASIEYHCKKCHFSDHQMYPEGKTKEDPAFCGSCNP